MKDYQALRDEWYDKLRESEFDDIENTDHPCQPLKDWHSFYFASDYHPIVFENHQTYFQMACNFCEQHKFSRPFEHLVWQYHCKGLSQREIADALNKGKTTIQKIVSSISAFMKVGL